MGDLKTTGEYLLAGLVGTVLGAAAAILYAPESGKNTRSRLRLEARTAIAGLEAAAEELRYGIERSFSDTGDGLGYLIGSATARTLYTTEELIGLLEKSLEKLKSNKINDLTNPERNSK